MTAERVIGEIVSITTGADVVRVRQLARNLAERAGLSLVDQTKFITAASELARNALVHGGGGEACLRAIQEGSRSGVLAEFVDQGPGIADINLALRDGWTTGTGLGLGLSGSRRLVDRFEITSIVGAGTRVVIAKLGRA